MWLLILFRMYYFYFCTVCTSSGGHVTAGEASDIPCNGTSHAVALWRSWLRHRAAKRKVAVSIPDDVIENFFYFFVALEVDSDSNRNEYQEYFLRSKGGRCLGLTTLPPSRVDCLEIWEPQPSPTLRACPGL